MNNYQVNVVIAAKNRAVLLFDCFRGLADRVLEAMLYAGHGSQQGARRKVEPDWGYGHHELRRPGATLMLL
jgi:transposase